MLNKEFLNEMFLGALTFELSKYSHIEFCYTADNVPSTGKAIHDMYVNAIRYKGLFRVLNSSNNAQYLYFTPEINLLYRTLHDLHHAEAYAIGGGGTTKICDELRLNCKMAWLAFSYTLSRTNLESALAVFFAVYHDNVGQVRYWEQNQDFCKDQNANTVKLLNNCVGVTNLINGRTSQAKQVMLGYMKACNFSG